MNFKHLSKVKESYFHHMKSALYFSYQMAIGSFCVFIHAFYPDVFESKASDICKSIINKVDQKIIS